MAELAVVLPVIVLLVLAVLQVGVVARDHLVVHHAAREAARRAAVAPTATEARAGAMAATSSLDRGRLTVALSGGRTSGELVTARVEYRAATDVPLVGALVGDVHLAAEVTMRVE